MTIEIRVKCSLCGKGISTEKKDSEYPEGWPLTWCGPGSAWPEVGARLEPVRRWEESPIHLCQACVHAVGAFRDAAKNVNALIPLPDKD